MPDSTTTTNTSSPPDYSGSYKLRCGIWAGDGKFYAAGELAPLAHEDVVRLQAQGLLDTGKR